MCNNREFNRRYFCQRQHQWKFDAGLGDLRQSDRQLQLQHDLDADTIEYQFNL